MERTHLAALIDYMYWVNHRLLDAADALGPDGFATATGDTTRDLRATLVHELDVEWSWRLALENRPSEEWGEDAELRAEDFADVGALRTHWRDDEAEMRAWFASLSDADLAAEVKPGLSSTARPLWQFVMHIIVHATQQQADAATLLTAAGSSPDDLGYLEFLGAVATGDAPVR